MCSARALPSAAYVLSYKRFTSYINLSTSSITYIFQFLHINIVPKVCTFNCPLLIYYTYNKIITVSNVYIFFHSNSAHFVIHIQSNNIFYLSNPMYKHHSETTGQIVMKFDTVITKILDTFNLNTKRSLWDIDKKR